jgi:protein-glutamine gamma-glutamyltransferase
MIRQLQRTHGRPVANRTEYLVRDKLAWLVAMQAVITLPLLLNLPSWLLLVWAIAAFWRIQMFRGHWGAPGKLIKAMLTGICAAGMFASYSGQSGTETMIGLLVCAFTLKLLEVNSIRDAQLLILIGFIVCATQLLFNQTPQTAAYCLASVVLLLTSWRSLYLTRTQTQAVRLRRGSAILLHALPIMLVLFVVIPRLGPLWATPNQHAAKTGFSDSLSPGDLGNLALDPTPAFRASFNDKIPSANQLYWRGLVLDRFDGRSWQIRDLWPHSPTNTDTAIKQEVISYSLILEPHGQPWLFSLMTPQEVQNPTNSIRITADSLLLNRVPITQRMRYEVTSALQTTWPEAPQLTTFQRDSYTRLPEASNPKTLALARSWREQQLNDQQIVDQALAIFNREFTYTLQPPVLGKHSVDEFLFQTKRGFCEHFASSFSFLLRAAGVPARVVVGYQGGKWNPVENYLLVRQSDAHAWTEVWLDGKGWQMIDPTAAVAPNRIEQGINEALNASDLELVNSVWQSSSLLLQLQTRWDAANFVWQRWVLNYDNDAQEGLLSRLLGGTERWRLTLWLIALGLAGAALFAWILIRSQLTHSIKPEVRAIQKLEQKLAQSGHIRIPGETLGDFIQRLLRSSPEYKQALEAIHQQFIQIAYHPQPPAQTHQTDQHKQTPLKQDQLKKLERAVKQFPRI